MPLVQRVYANIELTYRSLGNRAQTTVGQQLAEEHRPERVQWIPGELDTKAFK